MQFLAAVGAGCLSKPRSLRRERDSRLLTGEFAKPRLFLVFGLETLRFGSLNHV